jgi:predicted acylesterase/phospholipase RssA
VMKRFIGGNTIAVEATVKVEYSIDADEFPSPLAYLRSRLSRRGRHALPTLPSLLIKSTLLGGAGGRNELREGDDLYINPPMREFGFLDWHRIYTMVDIGYRHGQQCVRAWIDAHPEMRRRDESPGLPREAAAR